MDKRQKYTSIECTAYKSLPNVLFLSKSNRMLQLHTSKSLPSCLKFSQQQFEYYKKISNIEKNKINLIEKKNSNPTIGELLGDNDLFHYHYYNQYSSPRCKRKRYYPQSPSRPAHTYRKQRRSNYFNTIKDSQQQPFSSNKIIQSIPETNQVYLYPPSYNYTPLPAYCYYCYSTMTSCCPCHISDCYTGLYQQEICYETSTSHHDYQRTEKYQYSDNHFHDTKTSYFMQ
jgi:hypothetical protein